MPRAISVVSFALLVFVHTVTPRGAQAPEPGFERLFPNDSLTGWRTISLGGGPTAVWFARDGVLSYQPGESWLASEATFTDFTLRLEYRPGADSDSGIFLRAPAEGYPSFTGMELEIKGQDAGQPPTARTTSAIYGAVAPRLGLNRPAGQWNQVEVSLAGRRLTASWNGERVHDVNLDDPAYDGAQRGPLRQRAAAGHIGFQSHATGAPVEYRNLRLRTGS